MRTYDVTGYPANRNNCFKFLITHYGYVLSNEEKTAFNYISEYHKAGIRVNLNYDIKDNFFYFVLIKGDNTKFPNDDDDKNIKTFMELFQNNEPDIDVKSLIPDDKQYLKSLEKNAYMLRKYGDRILKGLEWF